MSSYATARNHWICEALVIITGCHYWFVGQMFSCTLIHVFGYLCIRIFRRKNLSDHYLSINEVSLVQPISEGYTEEKEIWRKSPTKVTSGNKKLSCCWETCATRSGGRKSIGHRLATAKSLGPPTAISYAEGVNVLAGRMVIQRFRPKICKSAQVTIIH